MARMSIGDFARACGLSAKALRLYDELGLLRPAEVDPASGYRYYEPGQLDRARLVARLRLIGMSLERIRIVADLPAAARPAELLSYWRQVEADHASRRDQVAALVETSRDEETGMRIDEGLRVATAWRSGRGQRELDLDALWAGDRLLAVADGFGGEPSAAARVIAAIADCDELIGVIDPVVVLDEALGRATDAVVGLTGSGCTLTAVIVGDGQVAVAHVGDSRLHLVRDGRLQRLTRDHTVIQSLVDEGRLTPEEAQAHADRAVLNRALAPGVEAAPDLAVHHVQSGDRLVLTTDGVHGVVPAAALADTITTAGSVDDVAAAVEAAVLGAGAPDNYGVVVAEVP